MSHWKSALINYVRNPNHENVIFKNQQFLIIKDCYPKAESHFLILPRTTRINSIEELSTSDIELVESMLALANEEIVSKNVDQNLIFKTGFHSVPSMDLLHLHVISQDFCSPFLKNKRHYLSFTTAFFLEASSVIKKLKKGKIEVNT
jgi:aprataxin